MQPLTRQRIGELDLLRGLAIFLMILFHTVVDLRDFFQWDLDYRSGGWYLVGRASAILFMLLSGISSGFSRSNPRRGLQVLAAGMLVIAGTYWFSPEDYVRFGILQFLGCAMLLQPLAGKLPVPARLLLAALFLALGPLITEVRSPSAWGLPLGIMPDGFRSMDYYPLVPWYGVFLAGSAAGERLYPLRRSYLKSPLPSNPLCWMGRHSLLIYLLHQPLLLALLHGLLRLSA